MATRTTVPCSTCGTPVAGVDPARGMVCRQDVLCPACLGLEACINCRRVFRGDESKCLYRAKGLSVGPFCARCDRVITQAGSHGAAGAARAR